MKKLVPLFALLLLSLSLVSAVEINLDKTEYWPQETLTVEITGTFIDPFREGNIAIYSGGQVHPTPAGSDLLNLGEKYIYYAVLPTDPGNYSIQIQGVKYFDNQGQEAEEDIIAEFKIIAANNTYLSVNPGFISTTEDFEIAIRALGGTQDVTATFGATGESITKSVSPGIDKTFKFSIGNLSGDIESEISVGFYSIPVFLNLPEEGEKKNVTIVVEDGEDKEIVIVIKEDVPGENVTAETASEEQASTCSDAGGSICSRNERCSDGPTIFVRDAPCCLGMCEEEERGGIGGVVIGLILLLIVALVLWWLYKRAKKKKEEVPEEKIKARSESFKERMSGEEVRGGLSRT